MAKERHLEKPPITEAVIDYRVKLHRELTTEDFGKVKELLRERYPKCEEQRMFEGKFEFSGKATAAEAKHDFHGYWFKTEDELNIAQFRVDGFTFNRLKPYTSWDAVFAEASELWKLYVSSFSPELVTRIAARYINHLLLPLPAELSEYLTEPPRIPEGIPQELAGFFMRITINDHESGITVNIMQGLESSLDPKFATIVLDIDAFMNREFEVDNNLLARSFELIRKAKNRIFFKSVSEKTLELLK